MPEQGSKPIPFVLEMVKNGIGQVGEYGKGLQKYQNQDGCPEQNEYFDKSYFLDSGESTLHQDEPETHIDHQPPCTGPG